MAKPNKNLRGEFVKTIAQFVTAAFAFVAALAWNEAIKGLIDRFISTGAGLRSMFIYAFLVTALAVLVTYYLGKLSQEAKEEDAEKIEEEEKK